MKIVSVKKQTKTTTLHEVMIREDCRDFRCENCNVLMSRWGGGDPGPEAGEEGLWSASLRSERKTRMQIAFWRAGKKLRKPYFN